MSARGAGRQMLVDPDLARLADGHGVATSYVDWANREVVVSAQAVVAALSALGVPADGPAQVSAALREVEQAPWRRLLPPSVVIRRAAGSSAGVTGTTVAVRTPADHAVKLQVITEAGDTVAVPVDAPVLVRRDGRVLREVPLPDLPPGWHRLQARSAGEHDEATLIVAPARIALPPRLTRTWGWMIQLYALRSEQSWGVGDYADLATVVSRTAGQGGGVVLVNPLHAETPVLPITPSPYSPSSRRFRSPLWLRIDQVREYASAPPDVREQADALRPPTDPDRVQRDPAWQAKLAALDILWPLHRSNDLAAYRAELGEPLEGFALFCALSEHHGAPWQQWPPQLRRPDGPAVLAARGELADRVAFWAWLQMLVDEQLRAATDAAAGMPIGLVHDLAVGVDAGGADAWALQDALALGTSVGAPPDSFNQQGQDWGLPPWRPDRLRELGYAPFRELVQGVLRHAGGIRIDHVMGLFRLWWVPEGRSPAEGTYVCYDADAMLAVLALEATRSGALVVGEDLGTVEDRVRGALDDAGVFGSAVLWFERDPADGHFLPPTQWRPLTMATVTTHDLPTAAGFLAEEHVRVRDELGQLGVPVEQERAQARADRAALIAALQRDGLLTSGGNGAPAPEDIVLAMHAALAASPSAVVLAALGDAVGDLRQPNLPGTVDQYPNWRLPVADGAGHSCGLTELLDSPGVTRLAALLATGLRDQAVGSAPHGDPNVRPHCDRTHDQTEPVRTS